MPGGADRPPIRVVLAEHDYLVREAIKPLLAADAGIAVVAECDDGQLVPELIDTTRADVLITDIRLAVNLRRTRPALGVIVLSADPDVAHVVKLLEDGSDGRGYLLKDKIRDGTQMVEAVKTVADGGFVIDAQLAQDLVDGHHQRADSPLLALTSRELQILALVAEGKNNAAIAEELVLTKHAVEKHVNSIYTKLELGDPEHVSRRVMAALLYLRERPG